MALTLADCQKVSLGKGLQKQEPLGLFDYTFFKWLKFEMVMNPVKVKMLCSFKLKFLQSRKMITAILTALKNFNVHMYFDVYTLI